MKNFAFLTCLALVICLYTTTQAFGTINVVHDDIVSLLLLSNPDLPALLSGDKRSEVEDVLFNTLEAMGYERVQIEEIITRLTIVKL